MTPLDDPIGDVLRECELRLNSLATDGRLSALALATFVELSARIRSEMERRKGERRTMSRGTPDRRQRASAAAGDGNAMNVTLAR